jgi:hypothetical protein
VLLAGAAFTLGCAMPAHPQPFDAAPEPADAAVVDTVAFDARPSFDSDAGASVDGRSPTTPLDASDTPEGGVDVHASHSDALSLGDVSDAPVAGDAGSGERFEPTVIGPARVETNPRREARCVRWDALPDEQNLRQQTAHDGDLWLPFGGSSAERNYLAHFHDGQWERVLVPDVADGAGIGEVRWERGHLIVRTLSGSLPYWMRLDGPTWSHVDADDVVPLIDGAGRRVYARDGAVWQHDATGDRLVSPPLRLATGVVRLDGSFDHFWVVRAGGGVAIERCDLGHCRQVGPTDFMASRTAALGDNLLVQVVSAGVPHLWEVGPTTSTEIVPPAPCGVNALFTLRSLGERALVAAHGCPSGTRFWTRGAGGWGELPGLPGAAAEVFSWPLAVDERGTIFAGASWRLDPDGDHWLALPREAPPGIGVVGRSGAELFAFSRTAVRRLRGDERWEDMPGSPSGVRRLWMAPDGVLFAIAHAPDGSGSIWRWDRAAWFEELELPATATSPRVFLSGRDGRDVWAFDGALLRRAEGRWAVVPDAPCVGRFVSDLVATPATVRLRCGSAWESRGGGWVELPAVSDMASELWVPVGTTAAQSLDAVLVRPDSVRVRSVEDDRTFTVTTGPMPSTIEWTFVAASPFALLAGATVGEQFAVLGADSRWTPVRPPLLDLYAQARLAWTDGSDVVFALPAPRDASPSSLTSSVIRCALP